MSAAAVAPLDGPARAKLAERFGPDVAGWCDDLPSLVESVTARWHLRVHRALPAGGTSVLFAGRTQDADLGRGVLLLESLWPGVPLSAVPRPRPRAGRERLGRPGAR